MTSWTLKDRVVAVTGATGGLGSALAERLLLEGARVALLDLSGDEGSALADKLGTPDRVAAFQADVQSLASLESAVNAAVDHFGRLDVMVANAGVAAIAPLSILEPEAFDRVIDINLNGVWRTFRAALPHVEAQRGYLLAISSMAAFVHSPLNSAYTASKAGVWAMCNSVRLDVRHLGVGVGSVHPTFFPSPMMDTAHEDPAVLALWAGNTGKLFGMITREEVVDEIIDGMTHRRDQIVIPKRNTIVARAPGLFRRTIERLGFRDRRVREAIRLANPSGLPDQPATGHTGGHLSEAEPI